MPIPSITMGITIESSDVFHALPHPYIANTKAIA